MKTLKQRRDRIRATRRRVAYQTFTGVFWALAAWELVNTAVAMVTELVASLT